MTQIYSFMYYSRECHGLGTLECHFFQQTVLIMSKHECHMAQQVKQATI